MNLELLKINPIQNVVANIIENEMANE